MNALPTIAMTEQQIVDFMTEALGPNAPFTLEQLATLLFVLAIATMLLAMGLGYQAAKLDRRVKALEAAQGLAAPAAAPATCRIARADSAKEVR